MDISLKTTTAGTSSIYNDELRLEESVTGPPHLVRIDVFACERYSIARDSVCHGRSAGPGTLLLCPSFGLIIFSVFVINLTSMFSTGEYTGCQIKS
jgi:hypothetical protein